MSNKNIEKKNRLKTKVRRYIREHSSRLRLSVFRSNKYLSAQVIDDVKGLTIVSISDMKYPFEKKIGKREKASVIGKALADKMKQNKIDTVVFDRGSYKYAGRVRAFCEAVRSAGINV